MSNLVCKDPREDPSEPCRVRVFLSGLASSELGKAALYGDCGMPAGAAAEFRLLRNSRRKPAPLFWCLQISNLGDLYTESGQTLQSSF